MASKKEEKITKQVNKNEHEVFDFPLTPENLPYIRVTTVAALEQCQKGWASRYLLGQEQPVVRKKGSIDYSEVGTAVHAILEDYERSRNPNLLKDGEQIVFSLFEHPSYSLIPESERGAVSDIIERQLEIESRTERVLDVEFEFELKWRDGAPPIRGHIDKLNITEDESTIIIVDYKTNRRFEDVATWRKKIQQMLYAWAIRQLFPGKRVVWRLVYINLGIPALEWVTSSADDVEVMARVNEAWDKAIESASNRKDDWDISTYRETPNDNCNYCPVKASCDAYKAITIDFTSSLISVITQDENLDPDAELKKDILQYEKLSLTEKLVSKAIEELEAKIINALGEKTFTFEGKQYSVTSGNSTRQVKFSRLWPVLLHIDNSSPFAGSWIVENFDKLFSAKVGGIDELVKTIDPAYAAMVKEVIETKKSDKLSLSSKKAQSK